MPLCSIQRHWGTFVALMLGNAILAYGHFSLRHSPGLGFAAYGIWRRDLVAMGFGNIDFLQFIYAFMTINQ